MVQLRWVLILVVVEDGLVPTDPVPAQIEDLVLILVVVEDGLVHDDARAKAALNTCLNPCCSGRWSRTRICLWVQQLM